MDSLIKLIAKDLILVPPILALYVIAKLKKDERLIALCRLLAIGGLSILLGQLASHLYTNPRPPFKDGSTPLFTPSDYNGFPSDHTLFASAIAFWALYYRKNTAYLLLVIALVVGWARVAAHVHHMVDIIGALVITGISYLLVRYLEPKLVKIRVKS